MVRLPVCQQFAGGLLHRLLGALADLLDAFRAARGGPGLGEFVADLVEVVECPGVVALVVVAVHVDQADLVQGDGADLVAQLVVAVAGQVQRLGLGALAVADGLGAVGEQVAFLLDGGGHAVALQHLVLHRLLGADLRDEQRRGGRAGGQQQAAGDQRVQQQRARQRTGERHGFSGADEVPGQSSQAAVRGPGRRRSSNRRLCGLQFCRRRPILPALEDTSCALC
ncbi:hypothetical protein D9M69_364130 [compost metagenome]